MMRDDRNPVDDLRAVLKEHGVDNAKIITDTAPSKCELCGAFAELRPYGPKGERICFDCGMKDEATTLRRFGVVVLGDKEDE